ncbi:PrsW family intramembrane metalloprotease [bacterium]|nr:PrsW family intramembrane metalloprotease [bacterium]
MFLQLFLLAFVPTLIILLLFFFSDRYEKEPLHMLFICFISGAALSVPITLFQRLFPGFYRIAFTGTMGAVLFRSFIAAAVIEESLKFAAVKRIAVRSKHFNEPFDGMIYYVAVAAGFAVYEDFTYILAGSARDYFAGNMAAFHIASLRMALLRLLPGHILFAAVSGYFIARGRFTFPEKEGRYGALALGSGIVLHGLFNTIVFTGGQNVMLTLTVFLAALLVVTVLLGRLLLSESPFRKPRIAMSAAELEALRESGQYRKGNTALFFILFVLTLMGIMIIFFINHCISRI